MDNEILKNQDKIFDVPTTGTNKAGYSLFRKNYGFRWGPVEVKRVCSGQKMGVVIQVETEREILDIRITPKGFVKVGESKKKNIYGAMGKSPKKSQEPISPEHLPPELKV